jgi:carbon starvation protein
MQPMLSEISPAPPAWAMPAMPVMIVVLALLAIAYRYYSAFLAARVATLDDLRQTPAHRLNDGHNYIPTNKWVLFGHHFAAISGAGPLVGPVLAAQFGYLPGLIWIVVGVCIGGAVQDFLVLAASIRRGGRSLAQIAFDELGPVAGAACMIAILFIVTIALAGLGKVVVAALGGSQPPMPANAAIVTPAGESLSIEKQSDSSIVMHVPENSTLLIPSGPLQLGEAVDLHAGSAPAKQSANWAAATYKLTAGQQPAADAVVWSLPAKSNRLIPGSSWGTFTIASTIPIALLVGLYMYRIRPNRILEASTIGAVLTLAATVAGGWIAEHKIGSAFNLSTIQVVWSMAIYGAVASVLPVWFLLCPRDYLSSFLKIGTIVLLVVGTLIANPHLQAPAVNWTFIRGGPIVGGNIFPFLFITIMCGAISGFHALVSSGTTPKMIDRETDARMIGYGAMLIEGLVGVVAMIAAASLHPGDYYAINTDLAKVPAYQTKFVAIGADISHLAEYDRLTEESLRGRTGGAVTLAVGMASIFDSALGHIRGFWKYWYHFAIMFEALFILTTIDAGTRIGRFLLQECAGKIHPALGRPDWLPGAILSTAIIVGAWSWLITYNSFDTIWSMFGVANQLLAVIALAIVTAVLARENKRRYLWVTLVPMGFVLCTTTSAAVELLEIHYNTIATQLALAASVRNPATLTNSILAAVAILAIFACGGIVIATALYRTFFAAPVGPADPTFEIAPTK